MGKAALIDHTVTEAGQKLYLRFRGAAFASMPDMFDRMGVILDQEKALDHYSSEDIYPIMKMAVADAFEAYARQQAIETLAMRAVADTVADLKARAKKGGKRKAAKKKSNRKKK